MNRTRISRRKFLQLSAAGLAGLVLSSRVHAASPAHAAVAAASVVEVTREAPLLAAHVAAGQLPSLEQRLPRNPLVLRPINGIGSYGGRIKTQTSPLSNEWVESQYGHSPMRWIDDGLGILPGLCDSWEINDNNTVWTFHLREGLKWSDGQPCTTQDILFWWEDLVNYPGGPDPVPDFGQDGTGLAVFAAADDSTFSITYKNPAPLTAKRLAMWVNGCIGPRFIAPRHYLEQFHPKYNPAVQNFDGFIEIASVHQNTALPTLNPWMAVAIDQTEGVITWERNPYYYAVDPEGKQLPYVDGVDQMSSNDAQQLIADLRARKYNFVHFHPLLLSHLQTVKDFAVEGNYSVDLWDSGSGTGMVYFWNHDHPDSKKRALFRNPTFKQAMSYAINRPLIQQNVYQNLGTITTGTMSPKALEFQFNQEGKDRYVKCRDAYKAYDPEKAIALLNEMGLIDVNADGWREYPDGSTLEIFIDLPDGAAGQECMDVLAITEKNWQDIGLRVTRNWMPSDDFGNRWHSGQGEIRTNWEVSDGPDHLLYPSWLVPNEPSRWAPLSGQMLQVQGTPVEGTELEQDPWQRNPPRFDKADPQYTGTAVEQLHKLYAQANMEVDELKRVQYVWQMLDIHYQNVFYMGTVGDYPHIVIVGRDLNNVPTSNQLRLGGFTSPWIIPYPAITNPETYSFGAVQAYPMAYSNYSEGAPGSEFVIRGAHLEPNTEAQVKINGQPFGTTPISPSGEALFLLDTSQASPGTYVVEITGSSAAGAPLADGLVTLKVMVNVSHDEPVRPHEVLAPVIEIPSGIAVHMTYLPHMSKRP